MTLSVSEAPAPTDLSFLSDATVERLNVRTLNKTRIRFRVSLKKASKTNAPKWADVLTGDSSGTESDLEKVTRSEVGLKGIKVFKALNDAASGLRQEIQSIQDWMSPDNGDWLCPIDLAPLVWNQLLNLRDVLAPSLRERLKEQYEDGYQD